MARLPRQFQALEPFASDWALATELQRSRRRWTATPAEFRAFHDAMLSHLDEVLDYLDHHSSGTMPAAAQNLYHLALAFAEAAPHVELYDGANEVPNSFPASRFIAAHGEAPDTWA